MNDISLRMNKKYLPAKKPLADNIKKNRMLILMFLPGLCLLILFKYVPMVGTIMAFQDYTFTGGIFGSNFVGLQHFKTLFTLPDFINVIKNTLVISLLKILFGFPAPVILALILNEIRAVRFKKIAQTITYLPHFFSWVIISGLLVTLLSPNSGIINFIIGSLGGKPVYFLANKNWFIPTLIMSDIWKEVGWGSIIYLAALTGIPAEIYEAAVIDGAKRWQQILFITIPSIMPTVSIMLILKMGSILDAGFDQIFNLYNPAVYDIADIIDTYIYRIGIGEYQYSFATAASLFKSVIGLVMVLLTDLLSKKISDGEVSII